MKIAEHCALYLLSLAVGLIAETGLPGAANDSQSLSPPAQSTQAAGTNIAPVANASLPASAMTSPGTQGPPQRIYDNSAAVGARGGMASPDMLQDRAMSANGQQENENSSQTAGTNPRHGELGVWLTGTGRQGVRIGRITSGSAADRAGLRAGDVILQLNGQDTSSPGATARIVRSIPIGQSAELTFLRDGKHQQLQVAMEPARSQYQVGYRGGNSEAASGQSSDLSARTMRLEQQVESMTEELRQMRQEMMSLRGDGKTSTHEVWPNDTNTPSNSSATLPGTSTSATGPITESVSPPAAPGISTTPPAPTTVAPSSTTPAPTSTGTAPSTGGAANDSQDIFGTGTSPSSPSPASPGSSGSPSSTTK